MALQENETEIRYDEEFMLTSRGMRLLTSRWLPVDREPKALIFVCHGYGMECSITMSSTAARLVKAGFGVYGVDYEGHGKSDGLPGFVSNFNRVIDDCSKHFTSICEKAENKNKMRYLLGESMGGAVALLVHKKMPDYWDGAVLVAPMCKIADEMKPNAAMISVLTAVSKIIPKWKMISSQDIIDFAFKVPEVRQQIRANPYCYKGRPRLKTALELLRVSSEIERTLREVSLPFLVVHGEDDRVVDPSASAQLYAEASSPDKTLKLYPEMWHGLLYGEPPENQDAVVADIIEWLNDKSSFGNPRMEMEHKQMNEELIKVG